MRCSKNSCPTYINTYLPMRHQAVVHRDGHRYKGIFGGYGVGKTTNGLMDDEKHILSTPKGTTLLGCATFPQIEQTLERDLQNDLPIEFLADRSKQKKWYLLKNGHLILVKTLFDQGSLRSLNLTRYHIVEASEVEYESAVQLKTRLRNTAGCVFEMDEEGNIVYAWDNSLKDYAPVVKFDWRQGVLESNPDVGWIRSEHLMKSGTIYGHQNTPLPYYIPPEEADRFASTHIIPTKANTYLPPTYFEENSRGKPNWWIKRYLMASFDYSEGMVYPEFIRTVCDPFPIPDHWKRVIAWDYGIRDDTAILFLAIDPVKRVAYVYKEIVINDSNYKTITKRYMDEYSNIPKGMLYTAPVMDKRSINKRNDYDLRTIGELFLSEGVYLEDAIMDVDARILRVNTLIELGQLRIFNTCYRTIKEGLGYNFPNRELSSKAKQNDDKPVDKNNHCMNALEFACMELPPDLNMLDNLGYDSKGQVINRKKVTAEQPKYNPYSPTAQLSPSSYIDTGDFGGVFSKGGL